MSAAPSVRHPRGGVRHGVSVGPREQEAGSWLPGPRDRFVYKHWRPAAAAAPGTGVAWGPRSGRGPAEVCGSGEGTWRPGRCFFLSVVPWVRTPWGPGWGLRTFSVSGDAGGLLETSVRSPALGAAPPPAPPAYGALAALRAPGSARPAAGRSGHSRVPAWPFPGASLVSLPRGWAPVRSCPRECRVLSGEFFSGTGA